MSRTCWRAVALWRRSTTCIWAWHWVPGRPGAQYPLENKFVMIEPTGQIAWEYLKARPTPGPEAAMSVKSDRRLRQLDTAYGKLSAAICYDTDFPRLMAQAGVQQADLVLSPAGDWRAIDPRHTEIASFRAIEQGFNLVRQSNGGLSGSLRLPGSAPGLDGRVPFRRLDAHRPGSDPWREDALLPARRLASVAECLGCLGSNNFRLAQDTQAKSCIVSCPSRLRRVTLEFYRRRAFTTRWRVGRVCRTPRSIKP